MSDNGSPSEIDAFAREYRIRQSAEALAQLEKVISGYASTDASGETYRNRLNKLTFDLLEHMEWLMASLKKERG